MDGHNMKLWFCAKTCLVQCFIEEKLSIINIIASSNVRMMLSSVAQGTGLQWQLQ